MTELRSLRQDEWIRLCETIRRGYCILILGPDIAVDPDQDDSLPLSDQLAHLLLKECEINLESNSINADLPLAAELFLKSQQKDRFDLEIKSDRFLQGLEGKTTQVHRNLAALPFRLIIKTTHDQLIETALQENGVDKRPKISWYNFKDPNRHAITLSSDPTQPLVYGLFGDRSQLDSLVLSESDLLDFIVKVARGSSTLPDEIAAQLADPQKAFLFLGFGFHRWYARILVHLFRAHRRGARSIALEQETVYNSNAWQETALFFDSAYAISFRNQSWLDFSSTLLDKFTSYTETRKIIPSVKPVSGMPKLFLCHDNDDAEKVADLELKLRDNGFETWLDSQQLRGGEEWDRRIKRVIGTSVDYVLVLESPKLVSKVKGYVFKEIDAALERQKEMRRGFSFLIPTTLESCEGLSELNHLQRMDITTEAGFERLCEDILRDWQKQQGLATSGESL
ncbi:MAG: toll/interleukin-1 receptor domain-containing protein [Candidatus Thiodiazotropha sp.]